MRPTAIYGVADIGEVTASILGACHLPDDIDQLAATLDSMPEDPMATAIKDGTHLRLSGVLGVPKSGSNPAAFRLWEIPMPLKERAS